MTLDEMKALFEKHEDQYLNYGGEGRNDLMIFNVMADLVPGNADIVSYAGHEEIYLSIEPEKFADVAEESTIVWLIELGLRYDSDRQAFYMFV
jgi:hypothetical protein